MNRSLVGPVLLLTAVGCLLLLVGAAGVYAGLALAEPIHALLPAEITADAAAVGGAALALGAACALIGLVHVGLAAALRLRPAGFVLTGIVLCAVMAVLSLGWAVAALVSAASGSAPTGAMLPAGIGLVLVAVAYGWATMVLMRARERSGPPI